MIYTMTTQTGLTPAQKRRFVRELTKAVTAAIIAKVPQMPAEWDGAELRQYMADQYAAANYGPMKDDRRRMREYRNTIATTNL